MRTVKHEIMLVEVFRLSGYFILQPVPEKQGHRTLPYSSKGRELFGSASISMCILWPASRISLPRFVVQAMSA